MLQRQKICAHTHTHTYTHARTHAHQHTRVHARTHTNTHTHTHTHTHNLHAGIADRVCCRLVLGRQKVVHVIRIAVTRVLPAFFNFECSRFPCVEFRTFPARERARADSLVSAMTGRGLDYRRGFGLPSLRSIYIYIYIYILQTTPSD